MSEDLEAHTRQEIETALYANRAQHTRENGPHPGYGFSEAFQNLHGDLLEFFYKAEDVLEFNEQTSNLLAQAEQHLLDGSLKLEELEMLVQFLGMYKMAKERIARMHHSQAESQDGH